MSEPAQDIFEQVLLRSAGPHAGGLALLSWVAPQQGERRVQVYVNDQLYDISETSAQRQMWLHLDRTRVVRVELMAAPPEAVRVDYSERLAGWTPRFVSATELMIERDEALDVDSRVIVSIDGSEDGGHRLWEPEDSRAGFGGLFGIGEFGRSSQTGPGFGAGEFGMGSFDVDGESWRWRRDDLEAGEHVVELRVEDTGGREIGRLEEPVALTVDVLPQPARHLEMDENWVMRWN